MKREEQIFDRAMALDSKEDREAYLDEACAGDGDLRRRVNELVKAGKAAEARAFLASRNSPEGEPSPSGQVHTEAPEDTIGHYKLLQKIGEGGFGIVFMAEQTEPLRRRVALKVIKLGMDTRQVIARFEAERQALAMMDHPNIARVLDAGTTSSGRPYFVMELVNGIPVTQFCDRNRVTPLERLRLFMAVCHAVQHAHQKGVIHRDIKPSNILVTLEHGEPVPKVIDFGIAKAIHQKLTEKTLFTHFGQFIGTPAYMSPEQAEMGTLDVDTRTDVYSLGVLLFELLTGTPPLSNERLRRAGLGEIQRLIREEELPRPSTRLNSLADEDLRTVADSRASEPKALRKLLERDLDWILLKALEKDRRRRYDTPNELATDVRRFLAHEPIIARPPSVLYRLGKLARRRRLACAAVASVAAALILGAVVSLWQARLARRAEVKQGELRAQAQANSYTADMNVAFEAWQQGNLKRARALLKSYIPAGGGDQDLRGFEWRYLAHLCREESRFVASGDAGSSTGTLAASPRHSFVAFGSGHRLQFLSESNVQTAATLQLPSNSTNVWRRIALAPGATNLLLADHGHGIVRLWDLSTRSQRFQFRPHDDVTSTALAPNGKYFATADMFTIKLWSVPDYNQAPQAAVWTNSLPEAVTALEFSPDGTKLISSGNRFEDGGLAVWDAASGKQLARFQTRSVAWIFALAFSPDGTMLASSGLESRIYLWDFAKRTLIKTLPGTQGAVYALRFSPDGSQLLAAGADGTIRVWDPEAAHQVGMFRHPDREPIEAIAFAPGGQSVFGAAARDARVWDKEPRQPEALTCETGQNWPPLEISSDGRWLVTEYYGQAWQSLPETNRVKIWDLRTGKQKGYLLPQIKQAGGGTFSPDGQAFALSSGGDWLISLWTGAACRDLGSVTKPDLVLTNDFETGSLSFSPDSRILAVAPGTIYSSNSSHVTNTIAFWDVASRSKRNLFGNANTAARVGSGAFSLSYSPDGQSLAVGYKDGSVRLWEIRTWTLLGSFKHLAVDPDSGAWPSFSKDGRWLASTSSLTVMLIDVHDLRQPRLVWDRVVNPSATWAIAFAPDSKTLLTMGADGRIRYWNLATHKEALTLVHSEGPGGGLAFAPDGNLLVSIDARGTLRFWTAAPLSQLPGF
jgi:WD40 repeat protein/serine/threonine protein kinase